MAANPFGALYDHTGAYRVDVDTGEANWATNALTFATVDEAEEYARDLMGRWLLVRSYRVVTVDTPDRERVDRG